MNKMPDWKKELIICEFCEHRFEECDEANVELEVNPKKNGKSWKCCQYERDYEL